VLLFIGVLAIAEYASDSLISGLLFAATIAIAESLTAGYLWYHERLDPAMSYLDWVRLDLIHPRYIRDVHAERTRAGSRRAGS